MPTSASTGTEQMHSAGGGDNFDDMTKEELQEELRIRDLAVSGTKDELLARLREPADTSGQPEDQNENTPKQDMDDIERAKDRAVEQGLRDEPIVTEANATLIDNAGNLRNTPDGAAVVTREEDVVGGVRVDLPPSAPASPSAADLANRQGGTFQVARPDGTFANIDSDDPDFEEHAKAIREGKANH